MLVEVNVFVCWKCMKDMGFRIEVIDLYVDIEYRDCILFVVLSSFSVSFFLWKCIEDVEFCHEGIDLYVEFEERDCNYLC